MNIWLGRRLVILIERRPPRRCRVAHQTAGGPMRCIFEAGHPAHGHTLNGDLEAPPVKSPGLLEDRTR